MKKVRSSDIPTGEEMLTSVKEKFVGNAPGASAEDSDVDELTKVMGNLQINSKFLAYLSHWDMISF